VRSLKMTQVKQLGSVKNKNLFSERVAFLLLKTITTLSRDHGDKFKNPSSVLRQPRSAHRNSLAEFY